MSKINEIKERIASINKQKEELVAGLRNDFAPMFKELFDKSNGKIESFGWVQYTPYFNDGDECNFGVNCDYPYINGQSIDEIDSLDWRIEYFLKKDGRYAEHKTDEWDIELFKIVEEFKDVINSIDDEFLKDLFGDHVLVTVHSDGSVTISEYDHD
jgi:hypothetical protein